MKPLFKIASFFGLGLTVIPAFMVFFGTISWETHALLMVVGALLWFATAPFWLLKDNPS